MKYILSVLIIGLFLLSACSSDTITARPVDEQIIDVEVNVKQDLCEDLECSENSYCVSGECVCDTGFKMCNGECLKDNLCCDSGDCDIGEICENNICIKHVCAFNQVYDTDKEKCVCNDNSKWCSQQNKCIPRASCCVHADCSNDYACSNTFFMAMVCINDGREKCRETIEGQNTNFWINDVSYDVSVKSVSENFVSLKINDMNLDAQPINVPYELEKDVNIYVESTRIAGGVCKKA